LVYITFWLDLTGPSHFLSCGSPTGATLLKHRHLQQLGYALVVVPYWEWQKVRGNQASAAEYLRGKLRLGWSCAGEPKGASRSYTAHADEACAGRASAAPRGQETGRGGGRGCRSGGGGRREKAAEASKDKCAEEEEEEEEEVITSGSRSGKHTKKKGKGKRLPQFANAQDIVDQRYAQHDGAPSQQCPTVPGPDLSHTLESRFCFFFVFTIFSYVLFSFLFS